MFLKRVVVVLACLAAGALCRVPCEGGAVTEPRPGTVRHTMSLADGVETTLDAVMVERVMGSYVFVRDPWPGSELLPVYAVLDLSSVQASLPAGLRLLPIEVMGRTATAGGKRVIVATRIRLYVDSRGRPMFPLPKTNLAVFTWAYMLDLPLATDTSPTIPAPPDPTWGPPEEPVFDVGDHTVADAKINGGSVVLAGVQIISVHDANGVSPSFLYVQDRNTGSGSPRQIPCGIKVLPTDGAIDSLKPRDIVNVVEGTVAGSDSSDPECRMEEAEIEYVSSAVVPPPVGMSSKSTAGGDFGLQDALYLRTPGETAQAGCGLNPVGTLVAVWGRILWIEVQEKNNGDHVVYWVDDGSALERTVIENNEPVVRKGLKVIAWADSATVRRYEEEDYVSFVGVVGAEFSEDETPLPVPVVLVGRKNAREIIHVDGATGNDNNSGADWSNAKATVQGGMDVASEDDEVWVANGTYTKRDQLNEDNVAVMTSGVALYGGFHGDPNGETGRWQRNPETYETILDGEGVNSVVRLERQEFDGCVTARVDSLTIQHGDGSYRGSGGGVLWTFSEGVITNNLIRWNTAPVQLGAGIGCESSPCVVMHNEITANPEELTGAGGGILCDRHPSAYVAENEITNNRAGVGAGIMVEYSTPVIRDNIITGNTALNYGGGIYMEESGGLVIRNKITDNGLPTQDIPDGTRAGGGIACDSAWPRIEDNVIEGNAAHYSGGGLFLNDSAAEVINNSVSGNTATQAGGGICLGLSSGTWITQNTFTENVSGDYGGAISVYASSPDITRNTFMQNVSGDYGGAISVDASSPEISRNTFTANDGGDRGGAIWISNSDLDIINNLFVGNQVIGAGGGAIYAESIWSFYASPTSANIVNNTFVENSATSEDPNYGRGGALVTYCNDYRIRTEVTLVNDIFYKNTARDSYAGNSIWLGEYSTGSLLFSGGFSDVSGSESYHYVNITPGTGCITEQILPQDPAMFVAGYYLAVPGPCYTPLDRGHDQDASPYDTVPLEDLNGVSRPQGDCTDMGACETPQ